MVSQIPPVLCPRCKKSVLGMSRHFGGSKTLVEVEIHHHADAALSNAGEPTATCKFKMTFKDSQALAATISNDIGGRK